MKKKLLLLLIILLMFSTISFAGSNEDHFKRDDFQELLSKVISGEKDPGDLSHRVIIKEYDHKGNFTYRSILKDEYKKNKINLFKNNYNKTEYIQPDFIRYSSYRVGESTSLSWGKNRIGVQNLIDKIGNTSNKIIVAVLDTGVDYNHELLKNRVIEGYNFVDGNTNTMDVNAHGTHVAGIIANSTNNNIDIMPIKVLNDNGLGLDSNIANGIYYAVNNGADIINMSLGGPGQSPYMAEAIKFAISKDVLVIVAAGNESANTQDFYPSSEKLAIVVSATDEFDSFADFSNYGKSVDIAAPGVNIYSSVPGNIYEAFNGTSMATAYVSALAALIKQEDPNRTIYEIEDILMIHTDDMGTLGRDDYFGEGIANVSNYSTRPREFKDVVLFDKKHNIPLNKEWTIEFNRTFEKDEIIDIQIITDNIEIPALITYYEDISKALIRPINTFENSKNYFIIITLNNGNKYKLEFKTIV